MFLSCIVTYTEEYGWIPEGWKEECLKMMFDLIGGYSFKSKNYDKNGEFGVVTIKNVQDGEFIQECANKVNSIPTNLNSHCCLKKGDLLMSLTGNVGRICIVKNGKYLLNQRVVKILGKKNISNIYIYMFLRQKSMHNKILNISKGTAQLNLSPIETMNLKYFIPHQNIITTYNKLFKQTYDKIVINHCEIQSLLKSRKLLLNNLMKNS